MAFDAFLLRRRRLVVTAASGIDDESLVAFLGSRGDIRPEICGTAFTEKYLPSVATLGGLGGQTGTYKKINSARLARTTRMGPGMRHQRRQRGASFEVSPPGRLAAEPSVFAGPRFGGVIEVVRRSVRPKAPFRGSGAPTRDHTRAHDWDLLSECAAARSRARLAAPQQGSSVEEAIARRQNNRISCRMLYALVQLGVLLVETVGLRGGKHRARAARRRPNRRAKALRSQVKARLNLSKKEIIFRCRVSRSAPRTRFTARTSSSDKDRAKSRPQRRHRRLRRHRAHPGGAEEAHDILRDRRGREKVPPGNRDKPPA